MIKDFPKMFSFVFLFIGHGIHHHWASGSVESLPVPRRLLVSDPWSFSVNCAAGARDGVVAAGERGEALLEQPFWVAGPIPGCRMSISPSHPQINPFLFK